MPIKKEKKREDKERQTSHRDPLMSQSGAQRKRNRVRGGG
jgi:hypothetical protein